MTGNLSEALLLVDDESEILSALSRVLRTDGYRILTAQSAAEALEILATEPVAVIVSDHRMPETTGVALLAQVRERHPDVVRMVLTGHADLDTVIASVNQAAIYKYLTKPWDNETLRADLHDAMRHYQLQQERRRLMQEIEAANLRLEYLSRELKCEVANRDKALSYTATHDAITGLPNRTLFMDHLQQALAHSRHKGSCVAVASIDLDGFGQINDTQGHSLGDKLLLAVAERLKARLRTGDTLACMGGDDFCVVLTDLNHADDAAHIVAGLLERLSAPFQLDGHELFMTASAGISTAHGTGDDPQTLIRKADSAAHYAKADARGSYQFYSENINQSAQQRLTLEAALRRAVDRGEFVLHYQPQWSLAQASIVGVEALLRWQRPGHGLISPMEFIPVLEQTGLIVPVGEWVLRTACIQARQWREEACCDLRMAVNLSAMQFRRADLVGMVERSLRDAGVDPLLHALELELTESLLMRNVEQNIATLQRLAEMGIKLAVDDFGTGYSSLSYLKRFPIHTLKIDQSFVKDMTQNADDASIVSAVIALGHSLGFNVIAEGVETEMQRDCLRKLGCDEIQGYLISRPRPPDEVLHTLLASMYSGPENNGNGHGKNITAG